MPTSTSTPLADNGVYLTTNGRLLVRYDAIEDEDPTVSLQNWVNFVTDNNVYLTVPSYSDTASDSLEVELEYRADVALWVERKLNEQKEEGDNNETEQQKNLRKEEQRNAGTEKEPLKRVQGTDL